MRRVPLVLLSLTVAVMAFAGPAHAQTTPTTVEPPATTLPTTPPTTDVSPTTVPDETVTTEPTTATTIPAATTDDGGGSDVPWIPIAIGVVVLAALVLLIAMLARRRGATSQAMADWRRSAADATAEAGATARLLSTGTLATGQIAQQILTSLRTFEDLEESAPDDATAANVERARRALQTLGLAIDADYRTRRAGSASAEQVTQSQESVQVTAGETDRVLRGVYRSFTEAD